MYLINYFLNKNILDAKNSQIESLSDEIASLKKKLISDSFQNSNPSGISESTFNELQETNERQRILISKLEKEIDLLKADEFKGENENKINANDGLSKSIFYLSTPNANGSFKDSRSNTMNPSMHMYEFALIDNNTARFKIIDNPVIAQEAINAPETYLKPVCDYLGGFNSSAKSIRTMEMGVAELTGDKWELRTKAKIKLL
jgi:hypothetical protein